MKSKFWEEELSWVLKHLIWKSEELNCDNINHYDEEDKLAKEFAHKLNIWMNYGYGDIYSFDEFLEHVKADGFIDYDGVGYFINNDTGEEIDRLRCNVKWLEEHKPENSDYIMWFNK